MSLLFHNTNFPKAKCDSKIEDNFDLFLVIILFSDMHIVCVSLVFLLKSSTVCYIYK